MFYRMTNGRQLLPLIVATVFILVGSLISFQKGRMDCPMPSTHAQPIQVTNPTVVRYDTQTPTTEACMGAGCDGVICDLDLNHGMTSKLGEPIKVDYRSRPLVTIEGRDLCWDCLKSITVKTTVTTVADYDFVDGEPKLATVDLQNIDPKTLEILKTMVSKPKEKGRVRLDASIDFAPFSKPGTERIVDLELISVQRNLLLD